jgi:DNA-binding CsgD family transcriptional regulator
MEERNWADAEIVRRIYDGLSERDRWQKLLPDLTRAFNSTYSVAMMRDRLTGSVRIAATDVLPRAWQRAYENHYSRLNPASFFHWNGITVGDVLTDNSYSDYGAYLRSEMYNDFFRPLRADHLMFIELRRDRVGEKSLVLRRSKDAGQFGQDSIQRLKHLGHHLCNSEWLAAKMHAAENRGADIGTVLERLGVAAFITDRDCKIHYMTAPAKRIVRKGEILASIRGRLVARQSALEPQLWAAIRFITRSIDHPVDGGAWRILRTNSFAERKSSPVIFVSAMMFTDSGGNAIPASLVIVNDLREQRMEATLKFAQLFGLTPAESKVVLALCEGRSLAQYASSAGISVLTARTLLKRAQEKTDTHSQAELVSLLLRRTGLLMGSQKIENGNGTAE